MPEDPTKDTRVASKGTLLCLTNKITLTLIGNIDRAIKYAEKMTKSRSSLYIPKNRWRGYSCTEILRQAMRFYRCWCYCWLQTTMRYCRERKFKTNICHSLRVPPHFCQIWSLLDAGEWSTDLQWCWLAIASFWRSMVQFAIERKLPVMENSKFYFLKM